MESFILKLITIIAIFRLHTTCQGHSYYINGMAAIDQIRTIDKRRIVNQYGRISIAASVKIKETINEMLVK